MVVQETNIYVLRLEKGRFYVGRAQNVERRFQDHCQGHFTDWTRKYRPIAIETVYPNVSPFEVDRITKEFMAVYGVHKVRGGSFSAVELAETPFLKREIWGATDCCLNCGRRSHTSSECVATRDIYGDEIFEPEVDQYSNLDEDEYENSWREDDDDVSWGEAPQNEFNDQICANCGYHGHSKVECYDTM